MLIVVYCCLCLAFLSVIFCCNLYTDIKECSIDHLKIINVKIIIIKKQKKKKELSSDYMASTDQMISFI